MLESQSLFSIAKQLTRIVLSSKCWNWIEFSQFHNGTAVNWCPSFNLCIWKEKFVDYLSAIVCMCDTYDYSAVYLNCVLKGMPIQRQIPYCVSAAIKVFYDTLLVASKHWTKTLKQCNYCFWLSDHELQTMHNFQFTVPFVLQSFLFLIPGNSQWTLCQQSNDIFLTLCFELDVKSVVG